MDFNLKAESQQSPVFEYLSRNAAWLRPSAATLMVVAVPALVTMVNPVLAAGLPSGVVAAAAMLGCFGVGLGAAMTDTASALLVRVLGFGACAGILLVHVFG